MELRPRRRPIALVGLMGAGKSAVARLLGERLGTSVADLDAMIEAVEDCTVAELFERSGESWFRRRERELLASVVADGVGVIACGGGAVLDPSCRQLLRERCTVVWLEVSADEAARRVAAGAGDPGRVRPLLAGSDVLGRLEALRVERLPLYAEVAHVRVATDGLEPGEVAGRVLAGLSDVA